MNLEKSRYSQVQNPAQSSKIRWENLRTKRPRELVKCSPEVLKKLKCRICGKKGEHCTDNCPYKILVPEGGKITTEASLFCTCCHELNGHPDWAWKAYAKLKRCFLCDKVGDHWTDMCPENEKHADPYEKLFLAAFEKPRRRPSTSADYPSIGSSSGNAQAGREGSYTGVGRMGGAGDRAVIGGRGASNMQGTQSDGTQSSGITLDPVTPITGMMANLGK